MMNYQEIDYDDIQLHAINAHCGIVGIRFTRNGRSDAEMIRISGRAMKELRDAVRAIGAIGAYVNLLQDGDPENEDPKKILDTIDKMIQATESDKQKVGDIKPKTDQVK